jgi:hypothetical protein
MHAHMRAHTCSHTHRTLLGISLLVATQPIKTVVAADEVFYILYIYIYMSV